MNLFKKKPWNLPALTEGMSMNEVLAIMDKPRQMERRTNGQEVWRYRQGMKDGSVTFSGGRVLAIFGDDANPVNREFHVCPDCELPYTGEIVEHDCPSSAPF